MSVKFCVPSGLMPLLASIMMLYVPIVPAAGVPLRMPLLERVTPEGRAPVSLNVALGYVPDAVVTVKLPEMPTTKVVLLALGDGWAGRWWA